MTHKRKPDITNLVYGKVPPQAPDLEKAILGAMMLDKGCIVEVFRLIKSADFFYVDAHQKIYGAIIALIAKGDMVDMLTVSSELMRTSELELVGGMGYIAELTSNVASSAHIETHCKIVVEKFMLRELIRISGQMIGDAYDGEHDVFELLDKGIKAFYEAYEAKDTNSWLSTKEAAIRFNQYREKVEAAKGKVGISTGFKKLDKENGGFKPGQLIVIAARPSVGKSALASEIILQTGRNEGCVGIINLEMTTEEVFGRMLAQASGIEYERIDRDPNLSMGQLGRIVGNIATLPIFFSSSTRVNIRDIWASAESLHKKHGLKLLVIDYLQLISESETNKRNREQAISEISRGLKMLAMHLQIPVIALSQLNRKSEDRADKKPTMADIRESGSIEQDADIIMLLHRDFRVGKTEDANGNSTEYQADLIIPKWRNGSPVDLKIHFEPKIMKFSEDGQQMDLYTKPAFTPPPGFRAMTPEEKNIDWNNPI